MEKLNFEQLSFVLDFKKEEERLVSEEPITYESENRFCDCCHETIELGLEFHLDNEVLCKECFVNLK